MTYQYLYYYDPILKYYVGRERANYFSSGEIMLYEGTTMVAPPNNIERDEVAIFDIEKQTWRVVENDPVDYEYCYWHYDSGLRDDQYEPMILSSFRDFPDYPHLPQTENAHVIVMTITNKIRFIQQKYWQLLKDYRAYRLSIKIEEYYYQESDKLSEINFQRLANQYNIPDAKYADFIPPISCDEYDLAALEAQQGKLAYFYQYRFELETLIYFMRSVLDSLVQLTYLLTNFDDLMRERHIKFNEIGKFLNIVPKTDIQRILIGDDIMFEQDFSSVIVEDRWGREVIDDQLGFLDVINSVSNSFKHSFIHDGLYRIESPEHYPLVVSCFIKFNNFSNERIYHQHNITQLMIGFEATIKRILSNQKRYSKE